MKCKFTLTLPYFTKTSLVRPAPWECWKHKKFFSSILGMCELTWQPGISRWDCCGQNYYVLINIRLWWQLARRMIAAVFARAGQCAIFASPLLITPWLLTCTLNWDGDTALGNNNHWMLVGWREYRKIASTLIVSRTKFIQSHALCWHLVRNICIFLLS